MRFQRRSRDLPSINLTPLIDILFLVLMFLVLTATFRDSFALDLTLPAAETAVPALTESPSIVRIVVTADGRILMSDGLVTLDQVEDRLRALPDRDELTIVVSADAGSAHGDVVAVMDRSRRAGIYRVRLEVAQEG